MSKVEKKLEEMGITLQRPAASANPLLRTRQFNNILLVSGHGSNLLGKLGADLTTEQGAEAAREAMIHCLESVKLHLGDLDRVKCFLKVLGMVNSTPDFQQHPAVMNGASSLLVEAFGSDIGLHTRSAVGMNSLPRNAAVEIELMLEIDE